MLGLPPVIGWENREMCQVDSPAACLLTRAFGASADGQSGGGDRIKPHTQAAHARSDSVDTSGVVTRAVQHATRRFVQNPAPAGGCARCLLAHSHSPHSSGRFTRP